MAKKERKFKFGDVVQVVKISEDTFETNIDDGNKPDEGRESSYFIGDVGIFVSYEGSGSDTVVVALERDGSTYDIDVDELELFSDASNEQAINFCMELAKRAPARTSYKTLDNDIVFSKDEMSVGCQNISKEDALQIANDILKYYQEQ